MALPQLRAYLGDDFLRYVLNIPAEVAMDNFVSHASAPQAQVVVELATLLQPALTANDDTAAMQVPLLLGQYLTEAGQGVPTLLRRHAGGALPPPPSSSDPVLRQLLTQLQEAYSLLLLPVDRFMHRPSLSSLTFNHPGRADLEAAVLADPALGKLFTAEHEGSGWMGNVFRSTGQGGSVQLWGFADQQIVIAWEWARLDVATPSFEAVADKLAVSLRTLRRAIQGKSTTVPVRLGLTGVLLPPETAVLDFGWASIRRVAEQDRAIIRRTGLAGTLQTTTSDGTNVVIDYAGDVVVSFEVPYKVVIREDDFDVLTPWPAELTELQGRVWQELENLRLGLALEQEDQPALVVLSWQLTLDPLASAAAPAWVDTRRAPNLVPRQLTDADVAAWQKWSGLLRQHRTKSTAIAIRRMLQALSERTQQDDVLVDAVVVWENLFGATQETTFRITTALAWLLGTDADDRAARQVRYKKLYDLRSKIVHGSDKLKEAAVPPAAQEAVQISLAALREVLAVRQDLLQEKDSAHRANRLLLDQRPQ
ncbi:hypothetical protein [Geodermatophilus sp. SYSU D01176]